MNFEIPDGLTDLLQDFTVEVLRKRPNDLLTFAAQYFEDLLEKRASETSKNLLSKLNQNNHNDHATTNNTNNHHDNQEDEEDDDIGEMPELAKSRTFGTRRVSVAAEKYNPEEDTSDEPAVVHEKSDAERAYLLKAVANIFMFRALDNKQIEKVIDAMFGREVNEGDVIIEQGIYLETCFFAKNSAVYNLFLLEL